MSIKAFEGSSEQSICDFVATNSSALSPRNFPPLQLKVNLPLQQVELHQMQTDERSQHSEELFVDKDEDKRVPNAIMHYFSKSDNNSNHHHSPSLCSLSQPLA